MNFLKIGFFLSLAFFFSCAYKSIESRNYAYSKLFYDSYENVYTYLKLALKDYEIIKDSLSEGIIETKRVPFEKFFFVYDAKNNNQNAQYKLKAHLIRGAFYNRPSVKVVIFKHIEKQPDFFSDPLIQPSDGLEEKMILYRIQREMIIAKSIENYHRRKEQEKVRQKKQKKLKKKAKVEKVAQEEVEEGEEEVIDISEIEKATKDNQNEDESN